MYFTAKLLASEHDVDLFVVDEEPVDDAAIDHLNERFGSVELFSYPSYRFYLNTVPGLASRRPLQTHYFEFAEAARWIQRHAESYDVVFANHVRTTEYVRSVDVPTILFVRGMGGRLDQLAAAGADVIEAAGPTGHILNLGHGVHRDTSVENVRAFVETAKAVDR